MSASKNDLENLRTQLLTESKSRSKNTRDAIWSGLFIVTLFAALAVSSSGTLYLWARVLIGIGIITGGRALLRGGDNYQKIQKLKAKIADVEAERPVTDEVELNFSKQTCAHLNWRVTKYDPETRKTERTYDSCGQSISAAQAIRTEQSKR